MPKATVSLSLAGRRLQQVVIEFYAFSRTRVKKSVVLLLCPKTFRIICVIFEVFLLILCVIPQKLFLRFLTTNSDFKNFPIFVTRFFSPTSAFFDNEQSHWTFLSSAA